MLLGSISANENHTQSLWPGGRCAVETVDEPGAMNDTLQPNLEGLLGGQQDQGTVQSMPHATRSEHMHSGNPSHLSDRTLLKSCVSIKRRLETTPVSVCVHTCAPKCKTSE